MQIGSETIRAIVERPLRQSEIEGLLRGLDETGKMQFFYRIAVLMRRTSAIAADPADRPFQIHLNGGKIFRSAPPAPDRDGVWKLQGAY